MPGLAPPALVGAAGAGLLGKEAENRRVRVWWIDDKASTERMPVHVGHFARMPTRTTDWQDARVPLTERSSKA